MPHGFVEIVNEYQVNYAQNTCTNYVGKYCLEKHSQHMIIQTLQKFFNANLSFLNFLQAFLNSSFLFKGQKISEGNLDVFNFQKNSLISDLPSKKWLNQKKNNIKCTNFINIFFQTINHFFAIASKITMGETFWQKESFKVCQKRPKTCLRNI